MAVIKRALLSVSDKTGVIDFAHQLTQLGVELLSTGGTASLLADAGVAVTEVADYTGFPEMLDGRVKTLHPKIHGGILGRRDCTEHKAQMAKHDIGTIDLVCVNLYPFAATVAKPDCTLEDAIENIDIGGPSMVRSAAKNWRDVAIVTDCNDYVAIITELKQQGCLSAQTRFSLARKAFAHTAQYDGMIANYLTSVDDKNLAGQPNLHTFPQQYNQSWLKVQDLRYGENPHQQAAFYRDLQPAAGSLANYQQLQGKELSYNNIAD
ncbi:MAG: bifunctional phosphoribosylaminoimidazolecarboxamide formyltransferase/IMP cyclohydrolase, partial [Snodgrassella sp.]|nr:bifunctional phosphoribosylaminoimidazolecarboxamide formyltransferase/IMP cyclohydrolase [Snodgrassella sp.]